MFGASAAVQRMHPVQRGYVAIYILVVLSLLQHHSSVDICSSESYAGTCTEVDDEMECSRACTDDGIGTGHCGPFKATSLCYCDECIHTTTTDSGLSQACCQWAAYRGTGGLYPLVGSVSDVVYQVFNVKE